MSKKKSKKNLSKKFVKKFVKKIRRKNLSKRFVKKNRQKNLSKKSVKKIRQKNSSRNFFTLLNYLGNPFIYILTFQSAIEFICNYYIQTPWLQQRRMFHNTFNFILQIQTTTGFSPKAKRQSIIDDNNEAFHVQHFQLIYYT